MKSRKLANSPYGFALCVAFMLNKIERNKKDNCVEVTMLNLELICNTGDGKKFNGRTHTGSKSVVVNTISLLYIP